MIQAILSVGVVGITLVVLLNYALQDQQWAIAILTAAFVAVLGFWGIEVHLTQAAKRKAKT